MNQALKEHGKYKASVEILENVSDGGYSSHWK